MTEDGRVVPKLEDEIVAATLVVQHGSVRHNAETRDTPQTSTQKDTD
jgi:NAD(P) transhydrogenase subunit alpha